MSISNYTFNGNLGRDAELKFSQGGMAILSFSVGVSTGYGDRKNTHWVRVSVFGKQAEGLGKLELKKGTAVIVAGELSTREYEGKTYLEVRANDVQLIGKREPTGGGGHVPAQRSSEVPQSDLGADFDDAIPFVTCVELP